MKKGTELIDEKLSELYAQLETLGSIREKTATIKEVTANLVSIGDERVKQVSSVLADFSQKTNDVVGDVEACIDKLNKVLVDIKQAPLIEELRGIRENVSTNIKAVVDGVVLVEQNLKDRIEGLELETKRLIEELRGIRENVSTNIKAVGDGVALAEQNLKDRIDGLEFETKRLANLLSKNSSEVSNIKMNVNNYATETKEGLTELDATVRDRTGQLDTKLDEGQDKQSKDIRDIGKSISDDINGFRKSLTESVSGCNGAVELCQKSVKTVRALLVVTLILLIIFMIATFPIIKVVWSKYFQ